jgi:hypothetical protein
MDSTFEVCTRPIIHSTRTDADAEVPCTSLITLTHPRGCAPEAAAGPLTHTHRDNKHHNPLTQNTQKQQLSQSSFSANRGSPWVKPSLCESLRPVAMCHPSVLHNWAKCAPTYHGSWP